MPTLRVFAGPNGSGKSTIIKTIMEHTQNGKKLNMGYYINADDIAQKLIKETFSFQDYDIDFSKKHFIEFAQTSGLINQQFTVEKFTQSFIYKNFIFKLAKNASAEQLAQIIARYVRQYMLQSNQVFSFETVFSHPSNIDIMREAKQQGYKLYLYFVATESPEINKYRVLYRVTQKGHNVPPDKIESRYYRSLNLLYDASLLCRQVFLFDNSADTYQLVAQIKEGALYLKIKDEEVPQWFKKYFLAKQQA